MPAEIMHVRDLANLIFKLVSTSKAIEGLQLMIRLKPNLHSKMLNLPLLLNVIKESFQL